jgi:serine/threonine protein kinase
MSQFAHTSQNPPLTLSSLLQEFCDARATSTKSNPSDQELQLGSLGYELEELSLLADRPGCISHKVRNTHTDVIMVRKSISVRTTPMRQLLRELSITRSAMHDNIVMFYGVYVSPTQDEVNILFEYCEGGSLKAIGERIISFGARIGEKVACRLAEGVRCSADIVAVRSHQSSCRYCKASPTCMQRR